MTILRLIFPMLAALPLVACSQSDPAPTEGASPEMAAVPVPAPADTPSPVPAAPERIAQVPERFQGIWDSAQGGCDPGSASRVEVAERGITFPRSHGAVTGVAVEGVDAVAVELAMTEGEESGTARHRLALRDNGRTLTVAAVDGAPASPTPLERCA